MTSNNKVIRPKRYPETLIQEQWMIHSSQAHIKHFLDKLCVRPLNMWASLISQLVKNSPAMHETPVQFLGGEDPLEKG